MTKTEIQAALEKAKKQLAVAKEADEKAFAEKKIAKLKKELAEHSDKEAEAAAKADMKAEKGEKPKKEKAGNGEYSIKDKESGNIVKSNLTAKQLIDYADSSEAVELLGEEMPDGEKRKKISTVEGAIKSLEFSGDWVVSKSGTGKKSKAPEKKSEKKPRPTKKSYRHPERNPYHIDPSKDKNKVGRFHELKKHDENTYTLVSTKDEVAKAEFDFVKKNGKWHVECRTGKRQVFNTLQGAITHVMKSVYTSDVLPLVKAKEEKVKADKERREERKEKGLPPTKTATETAASGVTKAVHKVKEKAKDDEAVTKDLNGILRSFQEGVSQIVKVSKEEKAAVDKKLVRSLIADLKKLL